MPKREPISDVRKKVTLTHDLISTSHHEAGHTIYALLHFMTIHSVWVFQNKQNKRMEGWTHYYSLELDDIQDPALKQERLHAEIGLSYAGLVAEKHQYKLHSGSDKFLTCLDGSRKDRREAAEIIKKYELAPSGRQRANYKKRMIRRVSRELQEHWDAVTAVAHGLFQKKRLNFEDLKNILTKKTENKKFWKERMKMISKFYNKETIDEKEFRSMISL